MLKHAVVVAALLLSAGAAIAQEKAEKPAKETQPELKKFSIGDRAPALGVGKWLKGEPITGFEKGKTYVVEFWATWCGPCKVSIPHLTEVQKKYKDKGVTVVGVSVWEADEGEVAPFVKEKGDEMAYTVGTDTVPALPEGTEPGTREAQRWAIDKGKMSQAWMAGADRHGIPTAFIVNGEGVVAWIGHPMVGMEDALSQIASGKYDIKAAAEKYKKDLEEAARRNRENAEAGRALRDFSAKLKTEPKAAYEIADKAIAGALKDNAMALNQIAWTIVDPESPIESPNLDVAMKAAARASELTKHEDPAILDTLARVYWLKGEKAKARELQQKAVDLCKDESMKEELEDRLAEYKAGK